MGLWRMRCAGVLLAVFIGAGCQSVGTKIPGVGNFAVVEENPAGIYRGAQPSREGITELSRRGVRTVVNLRADALPWEREAVEQAGMSYIWIPMVASRVDPDAIARFLDEVAAAEKPVFVHCQMGRDRTGVSLAVHRIVVDGWTREDAIREMYAHGYNWMLYPGIRRYLTSFEASSLPNTSVVQTPVE